MMLIYADRALLSGAGPPVLILQPFWGREAEAEGMPTNGRFARFFEDSPAFVQIIEPSSADVHVFPNMYEQCRTMRRPRAASHRSSAAPLDTESRR